MKKLKKSNLDELAKEMPVLSKENQHECVGGLALGSLLGDLWNATPDGTDSTYVNTDSGSFSGNNASVNFDSGMTIGTIIGDAGYNTGDIIDGGELPEFIVYGFVERRDGSADGDGWNKGLKKMTGDEFVKSTQAQISSLGEAGTKTTLSTAAISALLMKANWMIGSASLLITTSYSLDMSNISGETAAVFNTYLKQCKVGKEYVLNKSVFVQEQQSGWSYPGAYLRTNSTYWSEDGVKLGTVHGW